MAHTHHHQHDVQGTKNIVVALLLNAIFVVVEIVGGLLTNSIAILSDALHDFGDCLSLGIAWALQKKSAQGRDGKYSYGYKRFSLLGSVFLSGVLTVSSAFVLWGAVQRIIAPQAVQAQGMLWLAVVGIIINGGAALRLKRGSSLNERAVFLHIMEDVLGWVAVLVASVVMLFVDVPVLDPLLSIAISVWVLWNVFHNLRDTFRILLQATPEGLDIDALRTQIEALPEVEGMHDLHVWTLDGQSHIMTLHIVSETTDASALKQAIVEIGHQVGIEHVTIEMETAAAPCHHSCD